MCLFTYLLLYLSIYDATGCMQDGTVLWDAQSSKDCRVGLTLPREQADAIRCVAIMYKKEN